MRSFLIREELFLMFILRGTRRSDKPHGGGYFGNSTKLSGTKQERGYRQCVKFRWLHPGQQQLWGDDQFL